MSKYFYDTEFTEGTQTRRFMGMSIGQTPPTIDLISIGIVSEDGREYYGISKEFNLWEAWNRYDTKMVLADIGRTKVPMKEYWIRENVLKPIWLAWNKNLVDFASSLPWPDTIDGNKIMEEQMTYKSFRKYLNHYGKSRAQIAKDVIEFCEPGIESGTINMDDHSKDTITYRPIELYGYYADYDHVGLCWLFGKMLNLPKGFPMYTRDLKQMLDEKAESLKWYYGRDIWSNTRKEGDKDLHVADRLATFDEKIKKIKEMGMYPQQENEHNALSDALWNRNLYHFIKSL